MSSGETVRDQVDTAIGCIGKITGLLCRLESAPQEGARRPQRLRPGSDMDREDQVDARAKAIQPTLLDQIQAKPAEAKSCLIVSEVCSQNAAQPYISKARSVTVAMLQAEARHPADDEAEKMLIREQGRRRERGEHIHGGATVRVGHERQVKQRPQRARTQARPQPL